MKTDQKIYRRHRGMMALYVALGACSAFLSAWSASLTQRVLDDFTAKTLQLSLIFIYGGALVVLCLVNYAMNLPESRLKNGLYMDFKLAALGKMQRIDHKSYVSLGTGALVQRIEAGASAGTNVVFNFWLNLAANLLPEVVCSLLFISLIDLKVTLYLGAGYIAVFIISNLLLKVLYRIKERILIDEEAFTGRLVRGFMEMVVFRINRRYGQEIRKAEAARDRITKDRTKMLLVHEAFFTAFAVLVSLVKLGFLLYAYFAGGLTVGEFVALTALADKAYQPVAIFNVLYVQYRLDQTALKRFYALMDAPEDQRLTEGEPIDVTKGEIRIRSAVCRYDGREVLHGVSMHIPAGSVIGLAGGSGAGKSTLVRLMMGLIAPDEGTVTVDGTPLEKVYLPSYYRYLSYVPQEPPVFDGTLRENIAFDAEVTEGDLSSALRDACLEELVRRLPEGLDTAIGEKGAQLSGGERQRLAFARLFLQKEARILILDEATSALDTVTEQRVMEALMRRRGERTVVLIAHRLSTLLCADRTDLMKDGQLHGCGRFDALAEGNEYFRELLAASEKR